MKPSDYIRRGWTTSALARDSAGDYCHVASSAAVCWCIVGAIAASGVLLSNVQLDALTDMTHNAGFDFLSDWNNHPGRTQSEVIAALEAVGL